MVIGKTLFYAFKDVSNVDEKMFYLNGYRRVINLFNKLFRYGEVINRSEKNDKYLVIPSFEGINNDGSKFYINVFFVAGFENNPSGLFIQFVECDDYLLKDFHNAIIDVLINDYRNMSAMIHYNCQAKVLDNIDFKSSAINQNKIIHWFYEWLNGTIITDITDFRDERHYKSTVG